MADTGSATNFKVAQFEGPLDLLLFLIKEKELNIYDIPIAEITEQYLEYLDYSLSIDLDNLTEFYVMASTLLLIKSKMLLPVEVNFDDEDIEDPRKELVDQLIEYQKYKKLSELLIEKEDESKWFFERKKIQFSLPFEEESLWEQVNVWTLSKIFSRFTAERSFEKILTVYEKVSVNEKLTLMNELLDERSECMFTDLIVHEENLMDIVCAFMAILEAVKCKLITVWQNRMFGDIKIKAWSEDNGV